MATVKAFGEIEFWFALIKIITIVALIIIGIILVCIGFTGNGAEASFSNLWRDGGFFPNGMTGFVLSFQMVVFSFVGIELVGVTAGETVNPEKTIPKAINNIPIRILIFYIGALLVIMSIYPWSGLDPSQSPFVRVFSLIGIPVAAGVINFVVITSAASSCNSGIFSTSRMTYTLAEHGRAPRQMKTLNKRNVPAPALIFSTLVLLVGVVLNYLLPDQVFTLVTSISTICFIWVWAMILISHLRFRKMKPKEASENRFKMPLSPIMNWLVLAFFVFVLVVLAFSADTRMALFVTPIWFLILIVAYLLTRKKANE
ncbi:L-asparagine transporter-like permease [Pullulanibacillus pueri]|uniref:Amino acid permease/ SLC12A domain-containing protein n=1 Tax=Pullulanibacillus pueri TaxID=1437324 RepID=A0A8J2ZZS1_9BACL|nr:L-asparagine transporter-like permease [Pullulanibacillus pueri]GGH87880.1 hypothetical protein GCM10007096_38920 [Pullulanibacillus pueri]